MMVAELERAMMATQEKKTYNTIRRQILLIKKKMKHELRNDRKDL